MSSFHDPLLSYVPQIDKNFAFLQFCTDIRRKSKPRRAIYIYASESSQYSLTENGTIYSGLSHSSHDIEDYMTLQKYNMIL